jgi:hypothetical protein
MEFSSATDTIMSLFLIHYFHARYYRRKCAVFCKLEVFTCDQKVIEMEL